MGRRLRAGGEPIRGRVTVLHVRQTASVVVAALAAANAFDTIAFLRVVAAAAFITVPLLVAAAAT